MDYPLVYKGAQKWGTSILVRRGRYGDLKTRAAEQWATRRKFLVRRIDRRLDAELRRQPTEPVIALAGLDRMPARRLLGHPGFEYVIDAGLGATATDYQRFRINVFDRNHDPAKHFEGVEDRTEEAIRELLELPAYKELARTHKTGACGAATLAEKSVAVPFVSAFVGAVVVTQAIRYVSGEAPYATLTGDLCDVRTIRATLGSKPARVVAARELAFFRR